MQQERFIAAHQQEWAAIGRVLDGTGTRARSSIEGLPALCRRVSQHLSLARHRGYSADLVDQLNELAMRCHHRLYRPPSPTLGRLAALFFQELPRSFRREAPLVALAHALFYGPALAAFLIVWTSPVRVFDLLDPALVASLESMYDPVSDHFLRERASDGDALMFGFYIWNNVGIGFRTFASGALLGLGPFFFLAYNGVLLGAASAHLQIVGMGGTFFPFVVGHGSFKITALVLSGAAGCRLGLSWVVPGEWSRTEALRRAAKGALPMILGLAGMLVMAAVIEAFWSGRVGTPAPVKLWVGAGLWLLVYAWLLFGGRRANR